MVRSIQDDDSRFLAAVLLAILGVISVNFFLTPILFQPPGSVLFWMGGGMLLRTFSQRFEQRQR